MQCSGVKADRRAAAQSGNSAHYDTKIFVNMVHS